MLIVSESFPLICICSPPLNSDPPNGDIDICLNKLPEEKTFVLSIFKDELFTPHDFLKISLSFLIKSKDFHLGPIVIGRPFTRNS